MPQMKGYGRRTANQTNLSIFASSPEHKRKAQLQAQIDVDVARVVDQLASLAVGSPLRLSDVSTSERKVLAVKSGNEQVKTPRVNQETDKPADRHALLKPTAPKLAKTGPVRSNKKATTSSSPRVVLPRDNNSQDCKPHAAIVQTLPVEGNDVYHDHTRSILCQSAHGMTSFDTWSSELAEHFSISKIAEASYGEVYRLSLRRPQSGMSKADESVLKIIALKPPPSTIRRSKMTKAAKEQLGMMSDPIDVANEVRLMQHMACVPGFTNFRDVSLLKGRPGTAFVEAWAAWNAQCKASGQEGSTYPDPDKKTSYSTNQLWAVIEMQDAGTDLERIRVDNVWMAWDVFWSVAITLAKGEQSAEFEHRDLHMGNICVSSPDLDAKGVYSQDMSTIDVKRKLGLTDLTTTIIDYTVSRALTTEVGASACEDGVAFMDLTYDECLFTGDGDVEYQYDIYRYMRGVLYLDDAYADVDERWDEAEHSGRTWKGYHPRTNLIWLHFILHSLLGQLDVNGDRPDNNLTTKHVKRSLELQKALQATARLLEPRKVGRGRLGSAADLVEHALMKRWLDADDILGVGTGAENPTVCV